MCLQRVKFQTILLLSVLEQDIWKRAKLFFAHRCSTRSPWMLSASTSLPPPLSPSVPPSQVFQQWQRSSRMWQGVLGPEGQRGAVWAPHPPTAQLPRLLWTPSQGRGCVCACACVRTCTQSCPPYLVLSFLVCRCYCLMLSWLSQCVCVYSRCTIWVEEVFSDISWKCCVTFLCWTYISSR